MKRKILIPVLLASAVALSAAGLAACGGSDPDADRLLLHLTFDEGAGTVVKDDAGKLEDATLQYVFNDPVYQDEPQDPQWRETGAVGGSLLFDGYSNFIRYHYDDVKVSGSAFTVEAWVAPRMFEWDDPNAAANGTEHLTAIAAQYDPSVNAGFILGYQRHGAWSFQVGLGDRFIKVWDGGHPLEKYEWNHVAATFDGTAGAVKLYLNGEEIASQAVYENAAIAGCDDFLYIGRNPYGDSNATASCNFVSGLMDDVKLYKTAVSAENIKSYYESCLTDGKPNEITFEDIWLQNILTEDYHKPQYHGGPYQHWMNEPHAPIYYKPEGSDTGKYHLFFQFNLNGPYFRNICWGHLVSDDMVNWTPLKEVITPTAGTVVPDGVWSGGSTYDSDGVPVLFFTAGNDSWSSSGENLVGNQNIGIARPKDPTDPNLTEWVVEDEYAIKQKVGQGKPGDFRDAFVYQDKEANTWYMLICSASTTTNGGTALLYTTQDDSFTNWVYRGQVYEIRNQPADLGKTWELPILLPVKNDAGTAQKWFFAFSPAPANEADNDIFYFVGEFNKTTYKFVPDDSFIVNGQPTPRRFDFGNNVFTGPSAFIDPVSGKVFMFSIMQDQRQPNAQHDAGWAHTVGLAREIYLTDDGSDLGIRPVKALENYEKSTLAEGSNLTLAQANEKLAAVKGDMLRITMTVKRKDAKSFGIRLRTNGTTEYADFYCDFGAGRLGASLLGGEHKQNTNSDNYDSYTFGDTVEIDIYVDRSLTEAFYDGYKAVTARFYPNDRASMGVVLHAEGDVEIVSLHVAEMKSIYS